MVPGVFSFMGFVVLEVQIVFFVTEMTVKIGTPGDCNCFFFLFLCYFS